MLLIEIPSKSFLVGEYAVLGGSPCLLYLGSPCFKMDSKKIFGEGKLVGIPKGSPAEKYFSTHKQKFYGQEISFIDPYKGAGGLGASTAQFLGLYKKINPTLSLSALLADYRAAAWDGIGTAPSGADLCAQTIPLQEKKRNFVWYYPERQQIELADWPFLQGDFILIRTGFKVPTHTHLQSLNVRSNKDLFARLSLTQLQQSWKQANFAMWNLEIANFQAELENLGFLLPESADLILELKKVGGVLSAKGCGAMGADFVCAFVEKSQISVLQSYLRQRKLEFY